MSSFIFILLWVFYSFLLILFKKIKNTHFFISLSDFQFVNDFVIVRKLTLGRTRGRGGGRVVVTPL